MRDARLRRLRYCNSFFSVSSLTHIHHQTCTPATTTTPPKPHGSLWTRTKTGCTDSIRRHPGLSATYATSQMLAVCRGGLAVEVRDRNFCPLSATRRVAQIHNNLTAALMVSDLRPFLSSPPMLGSSKTIVTVRASFLCLKAPQLLLEPHLKHLPFHQPLNGVAKQTCRIQAVIQRVRSFFS